MLNLIDWNKPLLVNGTLFENSKAAYAAFKDYEGELTIDLNAEKSAEHQVASTVEVKQEQEEDMKQEYIFDLPTWLAKSNECPNRLKGRILKKTAKALQISAVGLVEPATHCLICGRELTNENSKLIGVGPICAEKFGVSYDATSVESTLAAGKKLQEKLFEMWLPISRVEYHEVSKEK